jgi:hypothetical protein
MWQKVITMLLWLASLSLSLSHTHTHMQLTMSQSKTISTIKSLQD